MSKKDTKTNKHVQLENGTKKDRRDVELTFLKKVNEDYPLRSSPDGNEQGGKRNRTTSDEEYDRSINEYGTPKRSRSGQRKTRTITNSFYAGTTTYNYNNNSSRIDNPDNQSNLNQSKSTSVNAEGLKFKITNNAISFAVEQNLPAIRLECEPKLNDQKEGASLIKELIRLVEHEFKQINPKMNGDIGFETWFIDNKGDLLCITRDINLFVFLCDVNHIPVKILNTCIKVNLPKHLPPQRSIIIKGVPNILNVDDIKNILTPKYMSIYAIEEVLGTNNGKSRYVRIDFLNSTEYNQILNSGVICIEGQCLHVVEYLAAPRVLFCSKCNEPGHSKKHCVLTFERCRRCGGDRKIGEHKECEIKCHNCKGEHISTDFKCPAVQCYRSDLIQVLQQHPEALPEDIQLFIPSQYRRKGEKTLGNRRTYSYHCPSTPFSKNKFTADEWPSLPPSARSSIQFSKSSTTCTPDLINNIQLKLNQMENFCSLAKDEYDRKNMEIKSKVITSVTQIQSLFTCFSTIIQKQNETISILKNTMNECLEFNRITNQALCFVMAKSGDQQYVEMSKQLSSIPFTEKQTSIEKLFSTYTPLIDEFTLKLLEATKHLNDYNGI